MHARAHTSTHTTTLTLCPGANLPRDPVPVTVLPLYLELMALRRQQDDIRLRLGPLSGGGGSGSIGLELFGLYPAAAGASTPTVEGGSQPRSSAAGAATGAGGTPPPMARDDEGAAGRGAAAQEPVAGEAAVAGGQEWLGVRGWGEHSGERALGGAEELRDDAGAERGEGSQPQVGQRRGHPPAPPAPG